MALIDAGRSERGLRSVNQDYLFRDATLGLFVVADGMGGHKAGEVASHLAVDSVVEFVRATIGGSGLTWPFPVDPELSSGANRLSVAMRLANRKVHAAGRADPELAGMGTTLVVVLIDQEKIVVGHVGDSRAYRYHAGGLTQVTRDHTWVEAMLAADQNARVANHPMRHVLTNGIGMREDVTPSVAEHPMVAGDQWLLCSDGVHGPLAEPALAAALALPSPEAAADEVVRRALDAGGSDNATAIVLRIG